MSAKLEVSYDKDGQKFTKSSVISVVAEEVNNVDGNYFERRDRSKAKEYSDAADIFEQAEKQLSFQLDKYLEKSNKLSAIAKKTSGDVRKAADDLSSGLLKVEKTANFSNLERYVLLLERAASAISILADLDKSGKLEKIASALK